MLRKLNLTIALLATLAFANSSFASVYQTVDISTGVNVGAVGNPLYPVNGRDDYWRVRSVPPSTVYSVTIQSWINVISGWNVIPGTRPIYGNNNNVGTSEYERCFCLQATDNARLTLTMRADNKANLFLNSYFANPIMQTLVNNTFAGSVQPVQFTYTAQNGLKVGKNCIRVRVNNEGGPTGFALKATLQGYGAQDTAEEGCCRQGSPVFSEAMRGPATDIDPKPDKNNFDPRPDKNATPSLETSPGRAEPIKRQDK
jgi:hypothetical protein